MRQNLTNMTPMLFSSIRSPFILLVLVWSRLDINLITFNRVFPTGGSSIPHVVFITLFWERKRFKLNSLKWINKKSMCQHRRPANITPFLCVRNLTFRQNLNKKSEASTYCKGECLPWEVWWKVCSCLQRECQWHEITRQKQTLCVLSGKSDRRKCHASSLKVLHKSSTSPISRTHIVEWKEIKGSYKLSSNLHTQTFLKNKTTPKHST